LPGCGPCGDEEIQGEKIEERRSIRIRKKEEVGKQGGTSNSRPWKEGEETGRFL